MRICLVKASMCMVLALELFNHMEQSHACQSTGQHDEG